MNILEVDINKFNKNIDKIENYTKKIVIPILKANAYGTYINKRLDVLNRFDIVGVSRVSEAIEIRNVGYNKEILVINPTTYDEIDNIIKYDITICISNKEFISELIKRKEKVKVQLEIETGMNRTGININDLDNICNIIKNTNIIVDGIYTHLSSADIDKEYTLIQLDKFKKSVNIAKKYFNLKYIHSSSSSGLLNYDDKISNAVRPGLLIYGYKPFNENVIDVEPICKLKSRVVFIKEVDKNTSIGYSRTFITNKKTKIATIQIGYADGLNRLLSNNGEVIINNTKCKIIGNICMDSIMADITGVDVNIGDDVYIFDNDLITIDEIAKKCNTISYEILTNISNRVDRTFVNIS